MPGMLQGAVPDSSSHEQPLPLVMVAVRIDGPAGLRGEQSILVIPQLRGQLPLALLLDPMLVQQGHDFVR